MNYCDSVYQTRRWKTREVKVGSVGVGGDNPVRIQSMTTSNTRDVEATIVQIIRLADAGCEIARVTVQGKKEAESLEGIKNGLLKRGYQIPVVADIHFYPPAALMAAEFADKVRVNPGNFVDRRATFKILEYTDSAYAEELQKIEEGFAPLVEKCKRLKKAIRIGTNHGSLSDRIMNRYGDSPSGMVESAFEFARVCRKYDFHDIIFSMKASHPIVMIEAYRLLVAEMKKLGWNYPLHLGVTEAGAGEDGRIKSAMGMGALLLDGIGDTIRVSLTEDPWDEIEPCKQLVRCFGAHLGKGIEPFEERIRKRERTGPAKVVVRVTPEDAAKPSFLADLGIGSKQTVDAIWTDATLSSEALLAIKAAKIGINSETIFQPKISPIHETRLFRQKDRSTPAILAFSYDCNLKDLPIFAGAEYGSALTDGLGEGICILGDYPLDIRRKLSFNILQSARMKMTRTDFISCPGCGRTLFELQEVSRRIREKTGHLPGVKIAIMGCIVNGPGEMADADFGYVGSKPGKIDLYVGKNCVQKDIDFADADAKLIDLIKSHGKWVDR